jgi:hypothetical protein
MKEITIVYTTLHEDLHKKWEANFKLYNPGIEYDLMKIDTSKIPIEDFNLYKELNKAFKKVKTPYILWTHDDVYMKTENWLKSMYLIVRCYAFASVVPTKVITPEYKEPQLDPWKIYLIHHANPNNWMIPVACCIFKKENIEKIGWLDEGYRLWYGDNDFSFRMEKFGCHAQLPYVFMHHIIYNKKYGETLNRHADYVDKVVQADQEYHLKKWE